MKCKTLCCVLFYALGLGVALGATPLPLPEGESGGNGYEALARGWALFLEKGDIAGAEKEFREALKADPSGNLPHFSLGALLLEQSRYQESVAHDIKVLEAKQWDVWSSVALHDLENVLDDVRDLATVAGVIEKRLGRKDLAWTERSQLRRLLSKIKSRLGDIKGEISPVDAEPYAEKLMILGPFENRDGGRFGESLKIEEERFAIDPEAEYEGRGRNISWFSAPVPWHGGLDLAAVLHPGTESLAYVCLFVDSQEEMDATVALGTGGASALWVNETRKYSDDGYYLYYPEKRLVPVHLRKGQNRVVVKVGSDRDSAFGVALRVIPLAPAELEKPGSALKADGLMNRFSYNIEGKGYVVPEKLIVEENDGLAWGVLGFCDSVLEKEPENPMALTTKAYIRMTLNLDDSEFRQVRPLMAKAAELAPKCSMVLDLAASVEEDDNRARRLLQQSEAASPDAFGTREWLLIKLDQGGFYRQAEKYAKNLLERRPISSAWKTLAKIESLRGYDKEARAAMLKALEISPSWSELYLELYNWAEGDSEADAILRDGMKNAASPEIRAHVASNMFDRDDIKGAQKLYRDAVTLNPYDFNSWIALSGCYRAVEDKDGERKIIEEALGWNPKSPDLLEKLGRLGLEAGDRELAMNSFRASLAIKADNPEVGKYLKELEPKRATFYAGYEIAYDELEGKDASANDHPLFNSIVLLDQGFVKVNPNGTQQKMIRWVVKVLRRGGVQGASYEQIPFDPSRQKVEVIHARVIQPDGTILNNANVRDNSYSGAGGGGTYGSYSRKVVALPQVKEGSIVDVQYTVEDSGENLYVDEFEQDFYIGSTNPTRRFSFVLDLPKDLKHTFNQYNTEVKPDVKIEGDRRIIAWAARDLPGVEMESRMPPHSEIVPPLRASSFTNWDEVGKWYWNLSQKQMELPEDIRKQIKEIVDAEDTREGKIRAVYEWVTENIRYISISFGLFGCKPHKAERTWRTRYGDCKDTAVLFCAMLKEAGIDAQVALVRTFQLGKEPTGIVGARLFNHAIAYVPPEKEGGRHYWLDGTTDYFKFGELPSMDRDSMALITGPNGGKLVTIDPDRPEYNSTTQEISVMLAPGGVGEYTCKEIYKASVAPGLRRAFETPETLRRGIARFTGSRFPGAKVTSFETAGAGLRDGDTSFVFGFKAPHIAEKVGEEMRYRPALMPAMLSSRYASERERKHDMMLDFPWEKKSEITVTLPVGAKLKSMPADVYLKHHFATYRRTCKSEGETVSVNTELTFSVRRLKAEDYAAFKDFCNKVDSSEEEWVVYADGNQPPAGWKEEAPEKPSTGLGKATDDQDDEVAP